MRFLALLMVACSGEAFSGQSLVAEGPGLVDMPVMSEGGQKNEIRIPSSGSSSAGHAGMAANAGAGQAGMAESSMAGSAGDSGAVLPLWKCRFESSLCQCYSDPSLFEPGWLNLEQCPVAKLCTARDNVACVCWDSEQAYQSALTVSGTSQIESCPPL